VPPVEAWEKVYVSDEGVAEDGHAGITCIGCHGGVEGEADFEAAHVAVVRDPDSELTCVPCHSDTVETDKTSLHSNLTGYRTVIYARSEPEFYPVLDEMMGNHCDSCHTTCGQCHVSRPANLDGGLSAGHTFKKVPPMNLTCTGCHGSRVNDEYKGMNEGVPADVHWKKGGMSCFECHSDDQMHGALGEKAHRYDSAPTPGCLECHDTVKAGDGNAQHTEDHLEQLACSVCHATTYKQCYSCHVQKSEDGIPYFKVENTEMAFKIGLNPLQGPDRPWKYVVLRHVPIAQDVFDYYGEDLMPNFDALPTWKYATPHTIQRVTPQNEKCTNCHGNADVFLTEDDVLDEELAANEPVIVREVPSF
jgi:hypothetical protein